MKNLPNHMLSTISSILLDLVDLFVRAEAIEVIILDLEVLAKGMKFPDARSKDESAVLPHTLNASAIGR